MTDLNLMGQNAVNVKTYIQMLSTEEKNMILQKVADALVVNATYILEENKKDMDEVVSRGLKEGLLDRLKLTEERIQAMSEGLKQIAALPDCLGEVMEESERPNHLKIKKVRVPLGVIGIIYEARPNVTADAFGLCFKTGNAVILKGGSDAINSNRAIVKVLRDTLSMHDIPENAVQLIEATDRSVTTEFMRLKKYVDVLIPRGSAGLIRSVVENSTIPVIETGTGNCHIYIDEAADIDMAVNIVLNAKTQRVGVCNACESLVVHRNIRESFLPRLEKALNKQVELRADRESREYLTCSVNATVEDFGTEYLDYIMSVKTVNSVDEAIEHINFYNTKHSECIVTEDEAAASRFLNEIDAACIYWNASTRFTDGFEFGFGAEIGISTQKLHARGPMGLRALTTYKYQIYGEGQIRG